MQTQTRTSTRTARKERWEGKTRWQRRYNDKGTHTRTPSIVSLLTREGRGEGERVGFLTRCPIARERGPNGRAGVKRRGQREVRKKRKQKFLARKRLLYPRTCTSLKIIFFFFSSSFNLQLIPLHPYQHAGNGTDKVRTPL